MSGPLTPLREPATILARPSLVTWTRLTWLILAAVASAAVLPFCAPWMPWLFAPLVASAAVTGGGSSAAVWALAGGLAVDLMPPVAAVPGGSTLGFLVGAAVVTRVMRQWRLSFWVPPLAGLAGFLGVTVADLLLRATASGEVVVSWSSLLGGGFATAVVTGLVTPRWTTWALEQHRRGRA